MSPCSWIYTGFGCMCQCISSLCQRGIQRLGLSMQRKHLHRNHDDSDDDREDDHDDDNDDYLTRLTMTKMTMMATMTTIIAKLTMTMIMLMMKNRMVMMVKQVLKDCVAQLKSCSSDDDDDKLIQDAAESTACGIEWVMHSNFLFVVMSMVVYMCLNLSRFVHSLGSSDDDNDDDAHVCLLVWLWLSCY